jgi:hypothetical protein
MALRIGDRVRIRCHDEGYSELIGTVHHVFLSGRCMVAVGAVTLLNLPEEWLTHEVSDGYTAGHAEKKDG